MLMIDILYFSKNHLQYITSQKSSVAFYSTYYNNATDLLGILLIALKGRNTRIVRIADKLKFSVFNPYSKMLQYEQ